MSNFGCNYLVDNATVGCVAVQEWQFSPVAEAELCLQLYVRCNTELARLIHSRGIEQSISAPFP
jgi:hypothetical protein